MVRDILLSISVRIEQNGIIIKDANILLKSIWLGYHVWKHVYSPEGV